ncbi:helix-turn-helix transcriptional regulator [uncultured Shewanella sp.]|uniref:helix-turn-helix transcriptional regulator n=1 Tax=Shewanella atlantica TaxID=271099 RepID=UPI00260E5DA4|nr:helix-turn-helix transcriptional regulator [uncultured Shewanella sp.]
MRVSIKLYINRLRLQHAQALLLETDDPVFDSGLEAGFGSVSRFSDIFHREFNMSPVEFRRSTRYQCMTAQLYHYPTPLFWRPRNLGCKVLVKSSKDPFPVEQPHTCVHAELVIEPINLNRFILASCLSGL